MFLLNKLVQLVLAEQARFRYKYYIIQTSTGIVPIVA